MFTGSTMEDEVQIIDTAEDNKKLCNDKKKSEMDTMLGSLVDNIKALTECMTKPKSV